MLCELITSFAQLKLINKRSLSRMIWMTTKDVNGAMLYHRMSGRNKWKREELIALANTLEDLKNEAENLAWSIRREL